MKRLTLCEGQELGQDDLSICNVWTRYPLEFLRLEWLEFVCTMPHGIFLQRIWLWYLKIDIAHVQTTTGRTLGNYFLTNFHSFVTDVVTEKPEDEDSRLSRDGKLELMFQALGIGPGRSSMCQTKSAGTRLTSHPGPGKKGGGTTFTYIENMVRHHLVSNHLV